MIERSIIAIPEWLPRAGGLATYYTHLAKALSTEGREVTLLVTEPKAEDTNWPGVRIINLEAEKNAWFTRLVPLLPKGWALGAYALAHGAAFRDWLFQHTNELRNATIYAAEFLGYASVLCDTKLPPIVVTAHGSLGQMAERSNNRESPPDLSFIRALESDALLRADYATAYSPMNADEWSQALGKTVQFIPPAFLPQEKPERRAMQRPIKGIVAGRLQDWKGAEILAETLKSLEGSATPCLINWYGADTQTAPDGGSMAEYLGKKYRGVWQKSFRWHQPVSREELKKHRASADFALVPSLWDTLNYTALEAMSEGLPTLISDGVGAGYLAKESMRFRAGNAESLRMALQALCSENALGADAYSSAKIDIYAEFTSKNTVKHHEEAARIAHHRSQKRNARLRQDSIAAPLLEIITASKSTERLSQHGGRDLLDALQKKVFARLGFRNQ